MDDRYRNEVCAVLLKVCCDISRWLSLLCIADTHWRSNHWYAGYHTGRCCGIVDCMFCCLKLQFSANCGDDQLFKHTALWYTVTIQHPLCAGVNGSIDL